MAARRNVIHEQNEILRARLADAEEMLRAIREGEIDALVIESPGGNQVYTLHSAEEPYRTLVEEMHDGAVVVTGRGDILYSNARFAALVGEPLESVVGSRIDRFLSAADRDGFDELLKAGSGRRRSSLIGSGSGTFDVSLSLSTTPSANGNQLNLIVTDLSEILEANRNRERAERNSRTKDEFLTMLAHELRNPLGAIINAVGVLELNHPEGESAARVHDMITRQVGHVSRLIDDLLDVERVVSGKTRLNRRPLEVAECVRQAVSTYTDDARLDRRIEVTTESVWVDGDAGRLQQVLTNLVGNAVKYTPPGGRIRVKVRAEDGDAVISVADNGFGISARLLPFIFDLYVQADRTLEHARGGLGIGLPLVLRLVELHRGTVTASSGGEGRGSTFVVRLKQIRAPGQFSNVAFAPEHPVEARRVLLIEDSADGRERLRTMLELAGHCVYDAADGTYGLELLNDVRPDVGIIDIHLPVMDGYEVAKRIRAQPHGRTMLLLGLAGSAADLGRSMDHGFDHQLVEPVDPGYLAHLLSSARTGIDISPPGTSI
jgi:PAS domain S-box-containing protein